MNVVEMLNRWAEAWSAFMLTGVIDATVLLVIIAALWLIIRRRASAQLGYCLFILVLLKPIVPIQVAAPSWLACLSPQYFLLEFAKRQKDLAGDSLSAVPSAPEQRFAFGNGPKRQQANSDTEFIDAEAPAGSTNISAVVPAVCPIALTITAGLMLLWATIASALFCRFCWAQWRMHLLVRSAPVVDASSIPVDFAHLQDLAGVKQPIRLVTSPKLAVPAVWGLWQPRLLLPTDLINRLEANQLTWILLHELAHVRRRDLWVALFQRLMQIVYFFHPAVWIANWFIDAQREYACDDAALAACSLPRRDCGDGFLQIIERANAHPTPIAPALGLFDGLLTNSAFIRSRLMRILDTNRPVRPTLSLASAIFVIAVAAVALPRLRGQQKSPLSGQSSVLSAKSDSTRRSSDDESARHNSSGNSRAVVKEFDWPADGRDWYGRLSPDGTKFARRGPKGLKAVVWDNTAKKETTYFESDSRTMWGFIWSPAGDRIAYTRGFPAAIEVVAKPGEEPRVIYESPPNSNTFPVDWSKDAKWLLCSAWRPRADGWGEPSLWYVPFEGGEARKLVVFWPDRWSGGRRPNRPQR
jgi:beta-lactamase regulating signal transducer with metallopeptidase domain